MDLWQYDATDLARLIRTGQASVPAQPDFRGHLGCGGVPVR